MIEVSELRKTYSVPVKEAGLAGSFRALLHRKTRDVHAVAGISFRIEPGERVGFLGPNGAGKTTTLKMLSGLLMPSGGTLSVLGHVPSRRHPDFLRRITLVMGQKQQLLWDLPPRETFELNRALFGLPRDGFRRSLDELVEALELAPLLDRPTRNLSLGERMKCELAAALLHRPDVLFLDEPTIGLDVTMQATVRRFIADWNRRHGVTVMLTSHYMDDIAALCRRVIVIDEGKVRWDGDLGELARRYAPDRRIVVRPTRPVSLEEARAVAPFDAIDGSLSVLVPPAEVNALVGRVLERLPVADLTIEDPPLEDVIGRMFQDRP
ncbi:MAG: ABC transporter ATP-binding protein [Myxococcales bacterium]